MCPCRLTAKAAIMEPRELKESKDLPVVKMGKRQMPLMQHLAKADGEEEIGKSHDSLPLVQHQVH